MPDRQSPPTLAPLPQPPTTSHSKQQSPPSPMPHDQGRAEQPQLIIQGTVNSDVLIFSGTPLGWS